jgi:hypothetical protein
MSQSEAAETICAIFCLSYFSSIITLSYEKRLPKFELESLFPPETTFPYGINYHPPQTPCQHGGVSPATKQFNRDEPPVRPGKIRVIKAGIRMVSG